MPNKITLPAGIQTILDEVYRQAAVTSVLNSAPSQIRPTQNVHEFCYPQMEVGGLGDYDRASGYTSNSGVNLVWKTVEADYDRGTKIMVDSMDNQESFDLAFGQAANILMREHVAPEGDAFTFAKIAALTGITFDYQSECHCSKTVRWLAALPSLFDYQSECHCSKTGVVPLKRGRQFDYQSECHCSKTGKR